MIFASDLDRTLIYSTRFINEENSDFIPIEKKEGRIISYISKRTIQLLKNINESTLFVPVTTRTEAEFNRIDIFKAEIIPKYAIVANGAKIIVNDGERKLEPYWEKYIEMRMKEIISPEDILKEIEKVTPKNVILSYRICDKTFVYGKIRLNTELPHEFIVELKKICHKYNYKLDLQTRKIHIIPEFINKWLPLEFLKKKEKEDKIISAGDSFLDLPMLNNSHKGFIPSHGLALDYDDSRKENMFITKNKGIEASEEILLKVIDELKVS
ncbi:HAD hydrolase family protein [Oceanirhabdus seepicola]|uniref:HAD hydrolase family protein n=1 Tax=Oceanirhabdus seepicola TaxID=2828781 RepID=A0A9J6NWB2_9CLOT|nr:HAD hydrolase family protein [Oceanirhabdus seepicola]MCM1988286.1 HAD hydrolase family protein [Oceanirhabdus seepicola]